MSPEVFVLSLVFVCSGLLSSAGARDSGHVATFYGGQYRVNLRLEDRFLSVSLNFRTSHETGVLFIARLKDNSGYFTLGLTNRQLVATVKHNGNTQRLTVGSVNTSKWQALNVHLRNRTLGVSLNSRQVTQELLSDVAFKDIYFGGPHTFFAGLYTDLTITQYFVGCLDNVNVMNKPVKFVVRENEYGMKLGCCPDPIPPSWCFNTSDSSLRFRAVLNHVTFSQLFNVSMKLRYHGDGIVLFSRTNTNSITFEVHGGVLGIVIHTGTQSFNVSCPSIFTDRHWHSLVVEIRQTQLNCSVDRESNHTALSLQNLPDVSLFYIGSPNITVQEAPHILSHLQSQKSGGRPNSFLGCIRNLQFNNIDIDPGTLQNYSPAISDVCPPPVSPLPTLSPQCLQLEMKNISWEDLAISTFAVSVNETSQVTITTDHLQLQLPENVASDSFIAEQIYNASNFSVSVEPRRGFFARSQSPPNKIMSFSYDDIRQNRVIYNHRGAEYDMDLAVMDVSVACGEQRFWSMNTTLWFAVILQNDVPEVLRRKEMYIAVGTRKVIMPDIITVVDADSNNSSDILFIVKGIGVNKCSLCTDNYAGRIEWTSAPGLAYTYFTQNDVNQGHISFQHFAEFGTAPVTVYLSAHDRTGGEINTRIEVLPHEAHINLTTNECLIVVEGTSSVLRTKHLNGTTTFEDQDPVLTYDIVTPPRYGHLERYARYHPGSNSTWLWDPLSPLSSFTQKEIKDNLIRYVHDNSTQPLQATDVFQFNLRSTNLSGPAGNFCIQVLSYKTLQQPNIVVNVSTITVLEGHSVVIQESVLSSSLAPPILIEWLEEQIDIEQLGITYVLERLPSCGEFLLDGRPLSNNSFTLGDVRNDLVTYNHSGSENCTDSFAFFAESRSHLNEIRSPDRTDLMEADIMIVPMNDHKPVLRVGNISVPEGGWVVITLAMINIVDEDLPEDTINVFLRKKEEHPTGHFAFYEHAMVPIRSFTMQNVSDSQVIFKHHLNNTAPLTYVQYLRVDDGNVNHTIRESITVTAIPLTVEVAPVHLPNSQCFAELDATAESLSVALLRDSVFISVNDNNGNDPNRVSLVTITIATVPNFGQILRSPNGTVVDSFKGHDLQNGTIFYHFSNRTTVTETDTFSLEFRYGHGTSGPIPFTVCINHIPIPILNHTSKISLAWGSWSLISTEHLLATDTRGGLNNLLYFNVTESPRHGILFNQSSDNSNIRLKSFTQEDVNNDLIAYSHRDNTTAEMRDSFQFQVCTFSAPPGDKGSTRYACTGTYQLTFVLHVVNLTVINNGFEVNERSNFTITKSELDAIPPEGFYVEFHIPTNGGPKNGELNLVTGSNILKNVRHFTLRQLANGRVFYKHKEQETLHDSFKFMANALSEENSDRHVVSGIVNIRVIPVNDWPPEFVNREVLHVIKKGIAVISRNILEAHDSDSDMRDEDLVYEMPPHFPFYGYVYYREAPSVKIYRWTEGDLRQNRVFYNHTGSTLDIRTDLIGFYITDGKHRQFSSLRVVIKDIILKDTASSRGRFNVTEGMQGMITKNHLQYNATNDNSLSNEDYIYNIVTYPTRGTLQFNNSTATMFTQQDLETGRLVYTHDHSNTVKDNFTFTITISKRDATSERYTFPIKIIAVDDDPPEVRYIERPLFVVELDIVKIDSEKIDIYDSDSQTVEQFNNITLTLIDGPHCGLIQKFRHTRFIDNASNFNKFDLRGNNVQYNHTELGHYFDYFVFNITDGVNPQNETYRVNIIILPWVIPLNISGVSVSEGDKVALERDNFVVLHPHLRDTLGGINVTVLPQHGSLINTTTGANVSYFTTSELENGSIIYSHIGDESTYDDFEFTYDAYEITGYDRRSNATRFPVFITLVNDEPPVLRTRPTIHLWVGETITLDQTYLSATDLDTPAEFLRYNFSVNIDGFIAFSDSPLRDHIQSFTQADVDARRVVFKHDAELDGSLVFSVSDGVQIVHGRINISAQYLRLRCETAAPLSVSMGGNVTITRNQLDCTTNDYSRPTPREIIYDVRELEYGKILVSSVETTRFNQSAVNNGLVSYVHTDIDRWESEDVPLVSASTPLANSPELSLTINITHPSSPHSKLAVNRRLEVVEGGQVCLDESVLDARNIRYRTWNEFRGVFSTVHELSSVFRLSSLPENGIITIHGKVQDKLPISFSQTLLATGSVCYRHDDSDTQTDSLHFQLTIEALNSSLATLNDSTFRDSLDISITPVNDEWPKLVTTELMVEVVNGTVFNFTQDILEIRDQDSSPEELEYVITTTPENGRLVLGGSTVHEGKRFKQVDINSGLLRFKPLDIGNGSFSFMFNDVTHMNETNITFWVCVVAHTLYLTSNKEATYKQNEGRVTITTDLLNTTTNGNRGDTHFEVKQLPSHGKIVGPADPLNFTQMDVDRGIVRYRNTDSDAYTDFFRVDIVNRNKRRSNVTVSIRVIVWGEVKTTEELDFNSGFSRPLSHDLLNLDQLQSALHEPPEINVITPPQYGSLELKFDNTARKRSTLSFSYIELKDSRVFYTWTSTVNHTVTDSMTVLVQGGKQGLQPGEARINMTIHPPTIQTPEIPSSPLFSTTTSTTNPPLGTTANPSQDGFPMYALIPILGVFFILVIMIAVVVVFCLTQQKRIRKKWQPKVANTTHPYPWSVSPTNVPRPGISTRYDYDPTVPNSEIENNENNSETSSGFSEPTTPVGYSPNIANFNHQVPRSRIGRVHSNVSITLLPRSSVASDVSLEDHNYFSLPWQPPSQVAVPVPIRPMSHSPVRRSSVESGCLRPAAETSGYETSGYANESTRNMPTPTETSISADPSPLPPSKNSVVDTRNEERSKAVPVATSDKSLDPELLKLFRSSPPLLKKHEYWV